MSCVQKVPTALTARRVRITGQLSVEEIVVLVDEWPKGVTAVTQEADGELLYWDAPINDVIQARIRAGCGPMLRELGIKYQIHSAYLNISDPHLANDWSVSVALPPKFNR
ncbi:hypothetical protein [Pseudomonas sp. AB12(2023)]|uniref:hypothetical protein n=1 Tax=Pseudomonas sp. AB12(2023) TaxID=3048597 RepID=UPI002B229101|nr:hypothetical protein [Pseudomonas sp. AB12(2023)]MEB0222241.1 hypothetical protein [Pseudomonas sp. AB12(2023)]